MNIIQIETAIQSTLGLQNTLNEIVDKEWYKANFNWFLASKMETVEFIDHVGWKWWKKQVPDYEQAFIELVDIYHFLLSQYIEEGGSVAYLSEYIEEYISTRTSETYLEKCIDNSNLLLIEEAEKLLRHLVNEGTEASIAQVFLMAGTSMKHKGDYTLQRFFKMYIAKNVLNVFRQENGYQEGTYVKEWNGEEDNVVMTRLMNISEDVPDLEWLKSEMEKEYKKVLK
jgi:hypothetical protein